MTTMMTQPKHDLLLNTSKGIIKLLDDLLVENEKDVIEARPMLLATSDHAHNLMTPEYNMDLALLKAALVAVVPKYSPFQPLEENGHRFLIAEDGMYLEVRRPWLYFVRQIARQVDVAMPYGAITPCTELAFGRISDILGALQGFVARARLSAPNETADMLVWNEHTKVLSVENVTVLEATAGSVKYECRALADHESIAIDMHSHGNIAAFFSDTDDRDDAGSVKISGVIGNLDSDTPTAAFRLCVLGLYLAIPVPAERLFEGKTQ